MSKLVSYVVTVLIALCLIGCGTEKKLSEEEIIRDLENRDIYVSQSLSITDYEIIKRQTNIDKKEDIVYFHVESENDDFSVVRNYKLVYILYDEGWLLEEINPYMEGEYSDETIPLHGVSEEIVTSYFDDLKIYNSNTCFASQLGNTSFGEIKKITEDTYYEVYQQEVLYEYPLFNEKIIITVSFSLSEFTWDAYADLESKLYLNENTTGQWHSDVVVGWNLTDGLYQGGSNGTGYIDVYLEPVGDTQIFCKIDAWIGSDRYNNTYGGGQTEKNVELEYLYDSESNIIGVLVCKPSENSSRSVMITSDGLIYTEKQIEWILQKNS